MLREIVDIAILKKADDIKVFDLRGKSDVCDWQLVCSTENDKQSKAICDGIAQHFKAQQGVSPAAIEGIATGNWILMDYGNLLIHIFIKQTRQFYAIDSLWPNAQVSLSDI